MFEEFALTSPVIKGDRLPEMIRVGGFKRNKEVVPLFLPFDSFNGLCFESNENTQEDVLRQMQYMALSLIKQVSSDVLRLTFVDIALNTNFPMLHGLKTSNLKFVNNRDKLKAEINALFETARYISTRCLKGDYDDLRAYNEVSKFKEPYHILFIANFPKEFHEEEINAISMLVNEGAKCGIRVIMNLDKAYYPRIESYNRDHFAKLYSLPVQMLYLDCTKPKVVLRNLNITVINDLLAKYPIKFDKYASKVIASLVDNLNCDETKQLKLDENFLSIPIGRSGREQFNFELGQKSGVYHGFIAGQSGTGKSTLLNKIITSIAKHYSPDELRLYLLDYKWGIEFQIYENHPNVELLLLDNSNFKVGVEALERLRNEIVLRSRLFRQLGAAINNIDEYNKKSGDKLPRILMIVDEVQQLFVDYESRKYVNPLVKEIAKQGRAFGIHLLFSSQSYMDCKIDDDTLSQMGLRIAFTLANGRECRAILGPDNDTPTKIPHYSAVYNAKNGDKDANIILKMDDFDKEQIIPTLKKAAKKYAQCKSFEKRVIVQDEKEEITEPVPENIDLNVVRRNEYKDKDYEKEFGF